MASFIPQFLRISRIVFTVRFRSRMFKANYGRLTAFTAVSAGTHIILSDQSFCKA